MNSYMPSKLDNVDKIMLFHMITPPPATSNEFPRPFSSHKTKTHIKMFKNSLPETPVGSDYLKRLFHSSIYLFYICNIHRNYGNTESTLKILVWGKNTKLLLKIQPQGLFDSETPSNLTIYTDGGKQFQIEKEKISSCRRESFPVYADTPQA